MNWPSVEVWLRQTLEHEILRDVDNLRFQANLRVLFLGKPIQVVGDVVQDGNNANNLVRVIGVECAAGSGVTGFVVAVSVPLNVRQGMDHQPVVAPRIKHGIQGFKAIRGLLRCQDFSGR